MKDLTPISTIGFLMKQRARLIDIMIYFILKDKVEIVARGGGGIMKNQLILFTMLVLVVGSGNAMDGESPGDTQTKIQQPNPGRVEPFEKLRVVFPVSEGHYVIKSVKKILVRVRFNKNVNRKTVVEGSTVEMRFHESGPPKIVGAITWVNNREFVWEQTSDRKLFEIFKFCSLPDGFFSLTLTDGIRSESGSRLDGDMDGNPGGGFTKRFRITPTRLLRHMECGYE